jgi:peroxiredoxin
MAQLKKILTLIVLVVCFTQVQAQQELSGKAPDFSLKTKSNKTYNLSDYQGKVVMLNFWATWCKPCKVEMPILESLYNENKSKNFVVLGVNVDYEYSKFEEFFEELSISYPLLLDPESKVSDDYYISAWPSSIFIDCAGNLKYLSRGYRNGDELKYKAIIKSLLENCED